MSTRYSQIFTLRDLFSNPRLNGLLPLINIKEEQKNGIKTSGKTLTSQVYEISKISARPNYGKFKAQRYGNYIDIGGDIITSVASAYNSVLASIKASKTLLSFIANNADIIRSALKESEKNKRVYGFSSKLHLRVQSMLEIKGMTNKQLIGLMNNIMEDIFFSGNYPKTIKNYKIVENLRDFSTLQRNWQIRVGE